MIRYKRTLQSMVLAPLALGLFLSGPLLCEVQAQYDNTIRLRYYTGDRIQTWDSTVWTNYHVIWHGFGIGSSQVDMDAINNGYNDKILLKYDDISYTFGQRLSLTLGVGNLSKSSTASSQQISSGNIWNAEKISGSPSLFAVVGVELFGFLELIIGTRASSYKVEDFVRNTSSGTNRLTKNLESGVGMIMTGLGIAF